MTEPPTSTNPWPSTPHQFERSLLSDQIVELIRRRIVRGRIPPGSKLVERELGAQLGVSRAPVRDALLQLEQEGLVVNRPHGRFVAELDERQFREIYQVRLVLEALAVEQAADKSSESNALALRGKLAEMREATLNADYDAFSRCDMELHGLIWRASGNQTLAKALNAVLGPFFMYVAVNAHEYDWSTDLALHEDLIQRIIAGDGVGARASLQRHLTDSETRLGRAFRSPADAPSPSPTTDRAIVTVAATA